MSLDSFVHWNITTDFPFQSFLNTTRIQQQWVQVFIPKVGSEQNYKDNLLNNHMGCIKLVMIAGVWIYNFHTKHNLQQPEDMTSWPVRILQDITMPLLENLYECVCRYTHPYITLPASFITKIQLLNTFILPSFTIIHLLYILLMLFVPAC